MAKLKEVLFEDGEVVSVKGVNFNVLRAAKGRLSLRPIGATFQDQEGGMTIFAKQTQKALSYSPKKKEEPEADESDS